MLDENDVPQLFLPNAAVYRCINADGDMPPEFRRGLVREECPEPQSTCNKRADIFRLGMILWLLASSEAVPVSSHFCHRTSCTFGPRCRCTAEHVNPVELPACLGSEIPIYYQGLIMICRNRRPMDRRTARDLLKHSPSAWELRERAAEAARSQTSTDNSQYPAGFSMWCDEGGELIIEGNGQYKTIGI